MKTRPIILFLILLAIKPIYSQDFSALGDVFRNIIIFEHLFPDISIDKFSNKTTLNKGFSWPVHLLSIGTGDDEAWINGNYFIEPKIEYKHQNVFIQGIQINAGYNIFGMLGEIGYASGTKGSGIIKGAGFQICTISGGTIIGLAFKVRNTDYESKDHIKIKLLSSSIDLVFTFSLFPFTDWETL